MRTRNYVLAVVLCLLVAACGSVPTLTAQQVVEKFAAAGIGIADVHEAARQPDSPLPNSYDERIAWSDNALNDGKGGQLFRCKDANNCKAIYEYFVALKALAGPYTYTSNSGNYVLQLNNGFTPEQAKRYSDVIATLP